VLVEQSQPCAALRERRRVAGEGESALNPVMPAEASPRETAVFLTHARAVDDGSSPLASAEREQDGGGCSGGHALPRVAWLWGCEQSLGRWGQRLQLAESHKGTSSLSETCRRKINEGLTSFVAIAEEITGFSINIYIASQVVSVCLDCRRMKRKALAQPN